MVLNTTKWETTPADDVRMNRVTSIANIGTYLEGLDKTKHGLLICTSSGGDLIKDHVYLCNADGNSLIDLSVMAKHSHSSSTTGGEFGDIMIDNYDFIILQLTKTNDLKKAQWIEAVTTSGTISDDIDGTDGRRSIQLLTGATSGGAATIRYPHLKLAFGRTTYFQTKVRIPTTTSFAVKSGVGADTVTAADSNTRKFNAEVCTAVNGNWFLRTANGSANSASDTGTAISGSTVALSIEHLPDLGTPETDMWHTAAGSVFQKTSHVPIDGSTADDNIIKHSIKNSTAANRDYFVYGSRLSYYTNDTWI